MDVVGKRPPSAGSIRPHSARIISDYSMPEAGQRRGSAPRNVPMQQPRQRDEVLSSPPPIRLSYGMQLPEI